MDENLRELERAAQLGDPESAAKLELEIIKRHGTRTIARELPVQRLQTQLGGDVYLQFTRGRYKRGENFKIIISNYTPDRHFPRPEDMLPGRWLIDTIELRSFQVEWAVELTDDAAAPFKLSVAGKSDINTTTRLALDPVRGATWIATAIKPIAENWLINNKSLVQQAREVAACQDVQDAVIRYRSAMNQVTKCRNAIGEAVLRELLLGQAPDKAQRKPDRPRKEKTT